MEQAELHMKRHCEVGSSSSTTDAKEVPPQAKKLRIVENPSENIINCVFRRSPQLFQYLNPDEVLNAQLMPDLTFLTPYESQKLLDLKLISLEGVVQQLLYFIRSREEEECKHACRKLIACIVYTKEHHRGHQELNKLFERKLPRHEWVYIQPLVDSIRDSPQPSPYRTPQALVQPSPKKPIPFIEEQGMLANEFSYMVDDLWRYFSVGDYKTLEDTVLGVLKDHTFKVEVDCQIVAMWFQSLIIMHRGGDYTSAIKVLNDALIMCGWENCVNRTILEGRIYQRMTQNYLMLGLKEPAMKFFELAKDKLKMVGRGYDKANMYCREAKILTALEPENRGQIEEMFERALSALQQSDPYFLASFPSITLSKAAFYLSVSFGSKPNDTLPQVDPADIRKAEDTLNTINEEEHILLEMRRCEYNFLRAELCRLQGKGEAREKFEELLSTPGSSKVKNILSLGEQRLQTLTPHS